ncbi:cd7 antigen-like isoform X1 [Ictalurus furcatus]|uniref:cd7 antigen-like isoform X1 n=1 Tax=Ictalurus furcatus TaxID=66913 RepID=UPI00234FEBCB|nr:cd7 antigen-like isoform X1 [Ictalurus furcatus]
MDKWLLKRHQIFVYLITFLSTAFGDMVHFHAHRNSSIEFSCVPPERSEKPFAFSLTREWLKKREVLYHNFLGEPTVKDITFKDRISETTEPKNRSINVSITHLQGYDTDIYMCRFHYNKATGFKNLSGNKFILYVQDYHIEPCSCYSYTPLLFSLSAAAGLLFFIILILTAVHCMKPSRGHQTKPQLSIPIYEEMNGVREKMNSRVQEDDISSLYVQPKKENPYIN